MSQSNLTPEEESRLLWTQACLFDGIHPDTAFVVFSRDNPYVKQHEAALARLRQLRVLKKQHRRKKHEPKPT